VEGLSTFSRAAPPALEPRHEPLNLIRLAGDNPLLAYGSAFVLESIVLVGALFAFSRLRIEEGRAMAEDPGSDRP
jgi:hypothetical protein